jgi:hypothetical protein
LNTEVLILILFVFKHAGNLKAVRQLLPFWNFPGLYLLLFTPLCDDMEEPYTNQQDLMPSLFPVLTEHGGVPHGTEIYVKINQCLETGDSVYRDAFHRIQSKI